MFREEAIAFFMDMDECTHGASEPIQMAIKALKQDAVLDQIRAEIEALSPKPTAEDVVDVNPVKDAIWETLADVLDIIDKYKEGEE